jgi:hypothetical protein
MAESSALKRLIKPMLSKQAVLNLCRSSTGEIRKTPEQLYQVICVPAAQPSLEASVIRSGKSTISYENPSHG